jgi:hypothetical protein
VSKTFSDRLKSEVELSTGNTTAMHFKLKRKLANGVSLQPDFRYATDSFEVGLKAHKRLAKSVSVTAGAWLNFSETSSSLQSAVGLKVKLSKLSSIRYSVETEGHDIKLVTTLQTGGLRLSLPLLISQVFASKTLLLTLIGAGAVSFLTKKLVGLFKHSDPKGKANKHQIERAESARQAEEFRLMMKDRADAKLEEERAKGGLEIISAYYGARAALQSKADDIVDVTVALRFLVDNSQLELERGSKAGVNGFYNPCLDDEPWLVIKYRYGGVVQEEWVEDGAAVWLPRR